MSEDVVRDGLAEMRADLIATSPAPPVRSATASLGYGVDLVCYDDFTPGLAETDPTKEQSLAQDNYHRLITPSGTLPDDLDYGKDVTEYLSRGTTQQNLLAMSGEIETELKKDDRNDVVSVSLSVSDGLTPTITITITITPADPDLVTFTLIIAVDSTGTSLETIF